MLTITEYSVEAVKDPFGILSGKRYEFLVDIELEDDDELYSEQGIYIRVIYKESEEGSGIVKYEIREKGTDTYQDFDLEDEELAWLVQFCKEHVSEAEPV